MIAKYSSHLSAVSTRFKKANQQVMQLKHRLGVSPDAEDAFLIDEWDDLAETSDLGDPREKAATRPERGALEPEAKVAHLTPIEASAGSRRT